MPGSANFRILKKKIFRLCFLLIKECPKLLSGLGINHWRRKTVPLWTSPGKKRVLQGITLCLVSTILDTVWWPGRFQTVSRGQELVFIYRHNTTMYLMKEKQGGPISTGLKRWPLKLIKHLADTTCVSPSPAGPTGCCPLNFHYLINLKLWVRAQNGCCILLFRLNQSFVWEAKFLQRNPCVLVASDEISEMCWPKSIFNLSEMVIPRYFADWTFSKVWLWRE